MQPANNFIALDVGEVRVGVALALAESHLPNPLTTLTNDQGLLDKLKDLISSEAVGVIVVGLPRGLDGQETKQTEFARQFAAKLNDQLDIPIHLQDEAGTSVKASEELRAKGKIFDKAQIDALAATYILEDFLHAKELA